MSAAVDAVLDKVRQALEACEAEGFHVPSVSVTVSSAATEVFPTLRAETSRALAVLARLTDQDPRRGDLTTHSSYRAGGWLVYAERHPDALPVMPAAGAQGGLQ